MRGWYNEYMAVKIIESGNACNKYIAECPVCRSKISYLGLDIRGHRNFPNGYIYCPRCRRPIPHSENNLVQDSVPVEEARTQIINDLLKQREEVSKQGKPAIIAGVVLFAVAVILLILGSVSIMGKGVSIDILRTLAFIFGFICLAVGIVIIVSATTARENKINRINNRLLLLNYNPFDSNESND